MTFATYLSVEQKNFYNRGCVFEAGKYMRNEINEITALALQVKEHLLPYLPFLIEGSCKGIGKSTGEIIVKEIWGKLETKLNAQGEARQAVADMLAKPDSDARKAVFQEELEKLLMANPDLAQEIAQILVGKSTEIKIDQSIAGNNNQTIGLMAGGIAIAKIEQLIQNFHVSPQKIYTLEFFWKTWSQDTRPSFSPNLVIGGREAERSRLINWLNGNPDVLSLQGDSPKEVCAFLAAVVQELEEIESTGILSRAIIIDCETSWQHLITSSDPLVLIAVMEEVEGIGQAIKNGHHVFRPSGRMSSTQNNLLPRIVRGAARQALKDMGFSEDKASHFASIARRSLSALRRKLALAPNIKQPAWAKPNAANALLAPLLASKWNDSCESDRKALEKLSGMPYGDLQIHLTRWANESDAPIRRTGNIWMITSQEDAWLLIAHYLTSDHLDRFKVVATEILCEINPKFELPPEEQFSAAIYGKVLSHSKYLRDGISEMLALMATLSTEISFAASQTGEHIANQIVWQLMEKAKGNAILWASIADLMPILAEATPQILLKAIDEDLIETNPALNGLFQDKSTHLAGCSPHTGLLWALENLAFNPDYLSQSAMCLVRLVRLDKGVNVGSRAIKSLRNIFVWWIYSHPDANNYWDDCLQIIGTIYKHEQDIAWDLMMSLISISNRNLCDLSIIQHQTRWRDWVPNSREKYVVQDYARATDIIAKQLISSTGGHIARWCSLIVSVRRMNIINKNTIICSLETLDPQQFSPEEQLQIYDCVYDEILSYRKHTNTWWSISPESIMQLEGILVKFEPNDPIYQYRYLFSYRVRSSGNQHLSIHNEMLEDLRTKALQEILDKYGWDGIIELSRKAKNPHFIGYTLAEAQLLPIDLNQFLQENLWSSEQWRNELARSYVYFNASSHEYWTRQCIKTYSHQWSVIEYGEFLLRIPFNNYLLKCLDVAMPETQQFFWESVQRIDFLEVDCASQVLEKILEFRRPCFAIENLPLDLDRLAHLFSPEQIAKVLEVSIRDGNDFSYDNDSFLFRSAELMNYLEKTDLSRDCYLNLELAYFPVHKHQRHSKSLFDSLSGNPGFFIEALQCIFPSSNKSIVENTDRSHALAELAWHLLEEWKQLPGVLKNGSLDKDFLRSWILQARKLAAECNLSEIADEYIGHSLSFAPSDLDGIWPHEDVRNLIEELASPMIEEGCFIQILNNRGVVSRSISEGGIQERELKETYESYFKRLRNRYPRTAAILKKVADGYDQDARIQDTWTELIQDVGL
jgi:hypothetical protein